ncbi:hypothetical protein DEU38_112116 [Rhodococcus sp. AG1013]|uniref:hypothetical protein n=2 Tax=unclassified Rhodococcus (in: high G+C Gram-positive bacteria) TaxID=192944 RepID=UPI000E2BCFE7|nr:hypothetical protein [Rhodococcus sp. AG1013]RDI23252.1 hypothetical protein DEU38_112116 [Rhodococcus sp. AG1013]
MASLLVLMVILWLCIRLVAIGLRYWRRRAAQRAAEPVAAEPVAVVTDVESHAAVYEAHRRHRWDVTRRQYHSRPTWTFALTDGVEDWAQGWMTGDLAHAPYSRDTEWLWADEFGIDPWRESVEFELFERAIADGIIQVPTPGHLMYAETSYDPFGTIYGFVPDEFEEGMVCSCAVVTPEDKGWGVETGPDAVAAWLTAVITSFAETKPYVPRGALRRRYTH